MALTLTSRLLRHLPSYVPTISMLCIRFAVTPFRGLEDTGRNSYFNVLTKSGL